MNCFSDNYKAFITASANKIPMIKSNERYGRLLRIHISPLPSTTKQQAENIPKEIPIKILLEKRVQIQCMLSHSVMSDSLRPPGLQPTSLLCPWNFPRKNTGVDCHFQLQGILLTQGLNLHLPISRTADGFFSTEPPEKLP